MLDNQHITTLINNLCFDLDCVHFNSNNNNPANPYDLKQWLKTIEDRHLDVLRDDETSKKARTSDDKDYGDVRVTYKKLVDAITAFDKEAVPDFSIADIKEVYVSLVSYTLHPKIVKTAKGFALEDSELVGGVAYEGDTLSPTAFKVLTNPARTRNFIEALIRKYKPYAKEDLIALFDRHANGRQAYDKSIM